MGKKKPDENAFNPAFLRCLGQTGGVQAFVFDFITFAI